MTGERFPSRLGGAVMKLLSTTPSSPTSACDAPTTGDALFLHEVEELRECLRRSQMKCDSLERERDYHVARAKELGQMLELRNGEGNNDEEASQQQQLIDKAVEVAELNHEAQVLRSELSKSNERIKELEQDCQTNRSVMLELSQIFRSVTMGTGHHQDILHQMEAVRLHNAQEKENSKEADDDDDEVCIVDHILSPEQALDLTLSTLREQVEALEDERQRYIGRIRSLQNYLEEQRRENEARELKIIALERQMDEFWSENMALKEFLDNSIDVLQTNDVELNLSTILEDGNFDQDNINTKNNNNNRHAANAIKPKKTGRAGKMFGWRNRTAARRKETV